MTRPFREVWINVPRRCGLWGVGAPTPARSQEFGLRRGNTVGGEGRRLGGCQSGEPKRLGLRDAEPQPCGGAETHGSRYRNKHEQSETERGPGGGPARAVPTRPRAPPRPLLRGGAYAADWLSARPRPAPARLPSGG